VSEDSKRHPRQDEGFALVVVVWMAGLMALIVATFTIAARSHLKEAAALSAIARAEALADAGVSLALADLVRQREERLAPRFPPSGRAVACAIGSGHRLTIALQDEAGRIDLNAADERLLAAALTGAGVEPGRAAVLADAIIDFRDTDDRPRASGAERAAYAAAGRAVGPKNAPFAAIEELAQVLGLEAQLALRLEPLFTLASGLPGIDPSVAAPLLASALGGGAAGAPRALALPPDLIVASPRSAYAVRVEVETADGVRFVREAVAEWTGRRNELPFILRRFRRGAAGDSRDLGAAPSRFDGLPAC
jgi:general secretion pathway protein K